MRIGIFHPVCLAYEDFNPSVVETGVSGSEETLINYCIELSRIGFDVYTFTQTQETISWPGGVWTSCNNIREYLSSITIFICWNDSLQYIQRLRSLTGSSSLIYLRAVNQCSTSEMYSKSLLVDVILTQSKWFITRYEKYINCRILFCPNGIHSDKYIDSLTSKESNRFIYASDYRRGLEFLLKSWPSIKCLRPNATLDVCYGWDIFDRQMADATPELRNHATQYKLYIENLMTQDGIIHHGRIGHAALDNLMSHCSYWLYPCNFPENCSTLSLKMQAKGLVPVIISSGGLDESVHFGFKTQALIWQDGTPPTPADLAVIQNSWLNLLKTALRKPINIISLQEQISFVRLNYSYASICFKLSQDFKACAG